MSLPITNPIIAVGYTDENETTVRLTLSGGGTTEVTVGSNTRFNHLLDMWVAENGPVPAYQPDLDAEKLRLKKLIAAERFTRLNNIQYDGRVFCMTDDKFALVDIWRAGAQRTEEIAPGAWVNKTWAHMSDGQGGYVVADWAACDAWSYQMFVSVASVTNAADAHNLAIDALTTQEEIDNYDTSTNWPS